MFPKPSNYNFENIFPIRQNFFTVEKSSNFDGKIRCAVVPIIGIRSDCFQTDRSNALANRTSKKWGKSSRDIVANSLLYQRSIHQKKVEYRSQGIDVRSGINFIDLASGL